LDDFETDNLGTFSGKRQNDPLTTLRAKCDQGEHIQIATQLLQTEGSLWWIQVCYLLMQMMNC
jgi:hypothetical protein